MILDAALASLATGVPTRTIQRWVHNGWLTDHGTDRAIRVDVDALITLDESRPNGRLHKPPAVA